MSGIHSSILQSLIEKGRKYEVDSNNPEVIYQQLKGKMLDDHPDRNRGEFVDAEARERYFDLKELVDRYEAGLNTSLVPISTLTEMIKFTTELQKDSSEDRLETRLKESISDFEPEIGKRLILPKVSLTTVTAIVSFIWLFPNQIEEHPVLNRYLNPMDQTFDMLWFSLVFYTAMLWIWSSISNERSRKKLVRIKTGRFQARLFRDFTDNLKDCRKEGFTKSYLVEFVSNYVSSGNSKNHRLLGVYKRLFRFDSGTIDEDIIENVTNIIISKAVGKNAISLVDNEGFEDEYRLSGSAINMPEK